MSVFWSRKNKWRFEMSNPYETPSSLEGEQEAGFKGGHQWLLWAWGIAFFLNMPVPVWLGISFTTRVSCWGIAITAAIFLMAGVILCLCFKRVGQCLVIGSFLTALSQFVPVLHLFAGIVAMDLTRDLGLSGSNPVSNDGAIRFIFPTILGVAWVSCLTGAMIAICGVSMGGLVRFFFPRFVNFLLPVDSHNAA